MKPRILGRHERQGLFHGDNLTLGALKQRFSRRQLPPGLSEALLQCPELLAIVVTHSRSKVTPDVTQLPPHGTDRAFRFQLETLPDAFFTKHVATLYRHHSVAALIVHWIEANGTLFETGFHLAGVQTPLAAVAPPP